MINQIMKFGKLEFTEIGTFVWTALRQSPDYRLTKLDETLYKALLRTV
jgi:hypothetical protein